VSDNETSRLTRIADSRKLRNGRKDAGIRGHFEGGTPFPSLKCFKMQLWMALPTIFGQNAPGFRILLILSQKFSGNDTPGLPQKRPRCLDPDTNFRLARQRSHCFCLAKRPLAGMYVASYSFNGNLKRTAINRQASLYIVSVVEQPVASASRRTSRRPTAFAAAALGSTSVGDARTAGAPADRLPSTPARPGTAQARPGPVLASRNEIERLRSPPSVSTARRVVIHRRQASDLVVSPTYPAVGSPVPYRTWCSGIRQRLSLWNDAMVITDYDHPEDG